MAEAILDIGDLTVVIGDGAEDEQCLPALEILGAEYLPPRTQQCWIPATPGQKFTVRYCWNGKRRSGNKRHAGIFCELFIDGVIVERAFLPLKPGENGTLEREWEIPGKFYRASDRRAWQYPFRFGERNIDANAAQANETGVIRVVLCWARHSDEVQVLFPPPTEALANDIASMLRMPASIDELRPCIDLRDAEPSDVVENDMRVARVDDEEYNFFFVYANSPLREDLGLVHTGACALKM
ncbi:hypothetical protein RSOLAG22IIIB_10432 [Rhizoctonia solani]|uniref:Uncharacterized protein n=1 Tax=Rhizoctonia solani TaxID=456999 RepID=A0A0K6G375_9AGAM|nr:hypothetical protein RSOLAG22IIIB_10432 [Rhizoctonia solani]